LEPLPRSDDLLSSLRAEVADPLWLLARQRQFGELRGEDAGSPVLARLTAASARISRYHPGVPGPGAAARALDHVDSSLPLEALVEREPVWSQPGAGRLRVEAGLHFLRLLRQAGAGALVARYLDHYVLADDDLSGDDADTAALRRAAVGRVPDGRRLFADFNAARGNRPELQDLPADPAVPAADRARAVGAANAYLRWWAGLVVEPPRNQDAWTPTRLEHGFAVQAELPGGRVVLVADGYRGGRLDWPDFRAETALDLGPPRRRVEPERTVRTVIPTPVSYAGMPAERFWEIEDFSVRFGALATGRTDLARLLLSEFALTYGNDWFVVPIDLPVGSVCDIESFVVTDTFGEATEVGPARQQGSSWTMFTLTAPGAPRRVQSLLFLPPVLLETQESEPLEEVAFLRDEMANVVWGVERTVQADAGTGLDRYEEHQRRLAAGESQRVATDTGDADLVYRLQSYVPEHWHPFVPVRAGAALQLELRPIVRIAADGTRRVVAPRGRVLRAARPLRLEEEEAPRSGVVVTRRVQLTRWTDGRTIAWVGRRNTSAGGEGWSGLSFDAVHRTANLSTRE